ncbi:hypothetical protein N0V90_001714 [Kalmusia sp. IMI 367209]|nr:hypothetical protein N0V90_001714 [Kalmusia sp. IMI 367209]
MEADPMDLGNCADGDFINIMAMSENMVIIEAIADYYIACSDSALDAQAAKYIEQLVRLVEVEAKNVNLLYPFHWLNTNGAAELVFALYGKCKPTGKDSQGKPLRQQWWS